MTRRLGFVLALLIAGAASPAKAGGTTSVKCAPNEDRVWVYESLDDFNVAAKLKCGDPVQIVGRVKGYVKIETSTGTEGYVLESAFPKSALPPEPEEKPNTVEAASLAFAARRATRPSASSPTPAPSASAISPSPASTSSAPVAVASTPAPAPPAPVVAPQPQPEVTIAASAPVANVSSQPTAAPAPAPAVATPPAPAASTVTVANVANPAPAPAQPAPVAPKASAKYSNPQPIAPSRAKKPTSAPATPREPAVSAAPPTVAAVATSTPAPPPVSRPVPVTTISVAPAAVPATAPSVASRVEVDADNGATDSSASVQPVSTPSAQPVVAPAKRRANPDDDEDFSVEPVEEDTSNCAHYFSAYGLSTNQFKWIAQNRRKAFPTVCPAPTPAMVDFVVIFTHDVDFYSVTMPNAVHVEKNGFSDWTPLTTEDTALMSASEANKSHHEYVWVFHTNRGAFDPAKFSSRRRPLYSKSETNTLGSRGGFRTVMDALTFIEQNQTSR